MFIEAENLEALKILQKSYAGSVKMIYIDPPYNTGNDSFIYPDKFSESREEYARRVGDTDDAGYLKRDGVFQGAWRKNGKDSGHYHSNWLSMMLPRLHLAKTLLREDGVIFISIDDNEQAQLKLLCDEVFGEENFVADIIWNSTKSVTNTALISVSHTHTLVYFKEMDYYIKNRQKFRLPDDGDGFENPDNDPRGAWKADPFQVGGWRPNQQYPITNPNTGVVYLPNTGCSWKNDFDKFQELLKNNRIVFGRNGDSAPQRKRFIWEAQERGKVAKTLWDEVETTTNGTQLLKKIFGGNSLFDNPKPIGFLRKVLTLGSDKDDLILDFFSGSGTTAHAVMQLNAEDGGCRRFICVQLPEETDEKSEARKAGFNTIAEIAKERIRRAGRQISDGLQDGSEIDTGFKVFKLAESGFKQWRQPADTDAESLQGELLLNIDSVLSETSSENLLYELMLRMGLKLTCKVSFSDDVYFVEDEDTGGLYAFLLERVDQGLIDAVLAKHPVKVAALDRLFEGDDALKSNTVLQMKDAGVMFECV